MDSYVSNNCESLLEKLVLNLRASTNISVKKLTEIIQQIKGIVKNVVQSTLHNVNYKLKKHNYPVDLSKIVNFGEMVQYSVVCFESLNTTYKYDNYFQENFNITIQKTINLLRNIVTENRNEVVCNIK